MDFKKRPYKRNERLSKEIRIILSDFILKEFNVEGSGIITISKVNISRDIRNAKIHFSVIDNQLTSDEVSKELNKKSKYIKGLIGKQITSKNIPELKFYFDDSIEYYDKLDKLFINIDGK